MNKSMLAGLLAGAALFVSAAEPDVATCIRCEGEYPWHLQGTATDGEFLYWSFSDRVVKTDKTGKFLCVTPPSKLHYGDICVVDGKVYVAFNGGKFNEESGADSRVIAFRTDDLKPVKAWKIPEVVHGAGAMTYHDGLFYVAGGLPKTHVKNYVYVYRPDFTFVRRIDVDSGYTMLGVQTIDFVRGNFLLGVYPTKGKSGVGLIRCPKDFSACEELQLGCYCGMVDFRGRFFQARAESVDGDRKRQKGVLYAAKLPPPGTAEEFTGGAWRTFEYDKPTGEPVVYGGWSRAEGVQADEYCFFLDVQYADGTWKWGVQANCRAGTHGWQKVADVFFPAKPVKVIKFYALNRGGVGRAWFKDMFLRRGPLKDGVLMSEEISDFPRSTDVVCREVAIVGGRRTERIVTRKGEAPAWTSKSVPPKGSAVWTADSMRKVTPLTFPTAEELGRVAVGLELAGGESESAQILVTAAPEAEWKRGTLEIPPLKADDGSAFDGEVKWERVGYVPREFDGYRHPISPDAAERWIPDPLLPAAPFRVRGGSTQGLWLTVRAARSAKAGVYRATALVRENGGIMASVPVTVRVRAFSLPRMFASEYSVSVLDGFTKKMYGEKRYEKMRCETRDIMLDHRLAYDDINRDTLPRIEDIELARSRGARLCNILAPLPTMGGGETSVVKDRSVAAYENPAFYASYREKIAPLVAELRRRGLLDGAYVYGFDELQSPYYAVIADFVAKFRRDFPDIPVLTTARMFDDLAKGRDNGAEKAMTDWLCPHTQNYDMKLADRLRAQGKKVWWYTALGPRFPYANFAGLEMPFAEGRLLGWMTHLYRADGFLFWAANYWATKNELIDESDTYSSWCSSVGNYVHGDGVLMYPGREHVLPSIRLAMVRDGAEDNELLTMATEKAGRGAVDALSRRLIRSRTDFTRDCSEIRLVRRILGDLIEKDKSPLAPLARKIALQHEVIRQDLWQGGRRTVFDFKGHEAWVVEPPEVSTPPFSRPWTWMMQSHDANMPCTGVAELLKRGFHHVSIDVFRHGMDKKGLEVSKAFQDYLTGELALAPKAKLIGLDRGGCFSVRYAAAYPGLVERIVLDDPFFDFAAKSDAPSPAVTADTALALAKSDIPVLLCRAPAFEKIVRGAGGRVRVIERSIFGRDRHGAGAPDMTAVDFMSEEIEPEAEVVSRRVPLLENGEISRHWYTWFQSSRMRGVDRKGVFSAQGSVLKASGADMGCVTTKKAFRDYRLTVEFRYADTDVQLNKTDARDGGILFHSTGADGVYGPGIWMPSFEYNIFQGATADLIVVGDGERNPGRYRASGCVDEAALAKGRRIWSPQGREIRLVDEGRIDSPVSSTGYQSKDCAVGRYEKPVGEWNKAVIVCHGDEAEFYLNGKLLGHYYGLSPSGGRIQLQSEGFGVEYRNIVLEPLSADDAAGKNVPRPECRIGADTAEIVIAPHARAAEKLAASEMSELLAEVFDSPVPVVNRPTPGRTPVFLGSNEWTRAAGIRTETLARDAFTMRCDGRAVYIAGRDDATDDPARHCFLGDEARWQLQFERATLFGVYEFLERYAGVRMYFPGELGTVVPKAGEILVPRLDETTAPDYTVRRWGYADGKVPAELLAGSLTETEFKLGNFYRLRGETAYVPCCHGQRKFGYVQRFRKTRPEYFAMTRDGKRMADAIKDPLHDGQFCQSSGIWDEMYLDISSYLRGEPASVRGVLDENGKPGWGRCVFGKFVDVMPQDGMAACYCPKCQAAYRKGDIDYATELVWGQTVRLADRLKADGFDCTLVLEAYLPYGRMPEIAIPDNVNVQVSRAGPWSICTPSTLHRHNREIAEWAEKVGRKVWLWTYTCKVDCFNVGMPDVPQMTPRIWGEYYKSLSETIVGAFSESESDRWLYNHLNYYVFSKVCWDTKTDVNALLDEYYRLMYGAGAPFVKRFFESLEHKWIREIEVDMKDSPIGPAVAHAPSEKEVWTTVYSTETLALYASWLDAAESAVAPGSLEARRLKLLRCEFLSPMQERASRCR